MTADFGAGLVADLESVEPQLAWTADALIPEDKELGMPSASQAGVVTDLVPRALRARPDLSGPFIDTLKKLPAEPPADALEAVRETFTDEEFDLVSHIIAGAYFLDTAINERLKYPGQESLGYAPDYDEIAEVTDRVIDRGPVYVIPPPH